MNYVYRYTDLSDNIIKYIGIVCRESDSRDVIMTRFKEHSHTDCWMHGKTWKIEYIEVTTKNDAHALEGHFIAKYGTDKWYNFSKTSLGLLSFLNVEFEWKILEECVFVNAKDLKKSDLDLSYMNASQFISSVSKRLAEVRHCLKIINGLLLLEDYSQFSRETLLKDKKELEYQKEIFINFQLGKKLELV